MESVQLERSDVGRRTLIAEFVVDVAEWEKGIRYEGARAERSRKYQPDFAKDPYQHSNLSLSNYSVPFLQNVAKQDGRMADGQTAEASRSR